MKIIACEYNDKSNSCYCYTNYIYFCGLLNKLQMKKIILLAVILSLGLVSCKHHDDPPLISETEHTLFMYMPWSGSGKSGLTPYFNRNLKDFETALNGNYDLLKNNKLVVFFSSSATEATMFEFKYEKGTVVRDTLKNYKNPAFTTVAGITSIIDDVIYFAPAKCYSMIVSGHGEAWLPVTTGTKMLRGDYEKNYWEYEGVPMTRWFGGNVSDFQTEIKTLAKSIANNGIKMDYILFDNCYMSSIEVAYDLKEVTNYIIASPTEIMDYGFPYHTVGQFLMGDFNLRSICEGFYNFYMNYTYPYGTIAVTVTAELDNLAAVMKYINQKFSFDPALLSEVQPMDGYVKVKYFDMGDYVYKLCPDADLLNLFNYYFERAVPPNLRRHTQNYYTVVERQGPIKINTFSGVTISDPSINSETITTKTETAWYKATH